MYKIISGDTQNVQSKLSREFGNKTRTHFACLIFFRNRYFIKNDYMQILPNFKRLNYVTNFTMLIFSQSPSVGVR